MTTEGADAAVHVSFSRPGGGIQLRLPWMSEEIENAARNVPKAIVTTMLLNGATGFAMVLAVMFCLGDVERVLVRVRMLLSFLRAQS